MSAVLLGNISSSVQELKDRLTGFVECECCRRPRLEPIAQMEPRRGSLWVPFPVGVLDNITSVRHPNVMPCGYAGFLFRLWPPRHAGIWIRQVNGNPFADCDGCSVTNNGYDITMPARFCTQDTETLLSVVISYPFDVTRQRFLGHRLRLSHRSSHRGEPAAALAVRPHFIKPYCRIP